AQQLFNTLLEQAWSAAYEDEAFTLFGKLSESTDAAEKLRVQAEALLRLTDRMIAARNEDLNKKIERPDKLTRTELRDKQTANLKSAREGFAERLAKAMTEVPKELMPWVKIERIYLDAILERNPAQIAADCWEIVGNDPPKPLDPDAEA